MKKYFIPIVILGILIVAACKHEANLPTPTNTPGNDTTKTGGGNDTTNNGGNGIDTGICFTRDVLPIFVSNCSKPGCHDAVSKQDGYVFTDYNSITAKNFVAGNANATELYEKITEDKADKIMPPPPASPLTAQQKDMIKRWIDGGAKNTTDCVMPCDTNKFTFATDVQPIFEKYCKGCHNSTTAPLGIKLDSYTGISAAINGGKVLGSIKHQAGFKAMPLSSNKLSDCEIRQIERWVDAGAQNN